MSKRLLRELERKQLIELVDATEAAIHGRLRDLQYDSDHHEERKLIEDAERTLVFLRPSLKTMQPPRQPMRVGGKSGIISKGR